MFGFAAVQTTDVCDGDHVFDVFLGMTKKQMREIWEWRSEKDNSSYSNPKSP